MSGLQIVPIRLPGALDLLEPLAVRLERAFQLDVTLHPCWFDPVVAYDASREQYNSTLLLKHLLDSQDRTDRILGIAGVDLFIPVLTYVFGEAQVGGRAAVASVYRLQSELYGLPRDDRLTTRRLEKESIHELGHTYGLIHCIDLHCVMRSSTYVEEIDLKTAEFCEECLKSIRGSSKGEAS